MWNVLIARGPAACSAAAVLLLSSAATAAAQSIQPLVSEYQREARGRFEVTNNGDQPLNVVIEPRGFVVGEDGEMRDAPMPAHVRLTLSDMSFRLPPRQSRFVFYEATSNQAPSWFVLYANLSGYSARQFSGVNVQLELPHIVYLLPNERWQPGEVRVVEALYDEADRQVELLVQNDGPLFGRITEVEIAGGRREVKTPGFPLFPHGRRRLQIAWPAGDDPQEVVLRAPGMTVERAVTPSLRQAGG